MIYAYNDKTFPKIHKQVEDAVKGMDLFHDARMSHPLPGTVLLYNMFCRGKLDTSLCKEMLANYAEKIGEASMQKASDWKRLWKKQYVVSAFENIAIYRGFESKSTGKVFTIAKIESSVMLFDFNLKDSFDEIEKIVAFAKKHYIGVDATNVLYNPVTKMVWLPMSDGGSFAVEDAAKVDLEDEGWLEEQMEKGEEDAIAEEYWPETEFDFVKGSIYSDEFEPEYANGYVPIGFYSSYDC